MSNIVNTRTEAFANFNQGFFQSILLSNMILRGSSATYEKLSTSLKEVNSNTESLLQQFLDAESDSLAEEVILSMSKASPQLQRETKEVVDSIENVQQLINLNLPYVLHVFLMAIFEAYLQDILIAICVNVPGTPQPKPGEPMVNFVDNMLRNKDIKDINLLFTQRFKISLEKACSNASTSIEELQKAKSLRNIHLHNGGRINDGFLKRVKEPNLVLHSYYPIANNYVTKISVKIWSAILHLDIAITLLYSQLPTTTVDFGELKNPFYRFQ